jgi:hypothetical protein
MKTRLLALFVCILLQGVVHAHETDYALIDGLCKKYQVNEQPVMLECRLGQCKDEFSGVELSIETVIGKSIDDCNSIERKIVFEGRAYIRDYSFLFDALDCVINGSCANIELESATRKPKGFSILTNYRINKVVISQPSKNNIGNLEVEIEDNKSAYKVILAYSDGVIYKASILNLIKEH